MRPIPDALPPHRTGRSDDAGAHRWWRANFAGRPGRRAALFRDAPARTTPGLAWPGHRAARGGGMVAKAPAPLAARHLTHAGLFPPHRGGSGVSGTYELERQPWWYGGTGVRGHRLDLGRCRHHGRLSGRPKQRRLSPTCA